MRGVRPRRALQGFGVLDLGFEGLGVHHALCFACVSSVCCHELLGNNACGLFVRMAPAPVMQGLLPWLCSSTHAALQGSARHRQVFFSTSLTKRPGPWLLPCRRKSSCCTPITRLLY